MNVVYVKKELKPIVCPVCLNEISFQQRTKAISIPLVTNKNEEENPFLYRKKMNCPHCQADLELRGFNVL